MGHRCGGVLKHHVAGGLRPTNGLVERFKGVHKKAVACRVDCVIYPCRAMTGLTTGFKVNASLHPRCGGELRVIHGCARVLGFCGDSHSRATECRAQAIPGKGHQAASLERMLDIAGARVVGVAVSEGAERGARIIVNGGHPFPGADRIALEACGIAQGDETPQFLKSTFKDSDGSHFAIGAEGRVAKCVAEHVTVHEHIDGEYRDRHISIAGHFQHIFPCLRKLQAVALHQVGPPCGDRGRCIGRKRPLLAAKAITLVRKPDRIGRLLRKEIRRHPVLEWQDQAFRSGKRRVRVIHHDEVKLFGELLHGGVCKCLQRALFPRDGNAGILFFKSLGGGNNREKTSSVVPCNAF